MWAAAFQGWESWTIEGDRSESKSLLCFMAVVGGDGHLQAFAALTAGPLWADIDPLSHKLLLQAILLSQ